MNDLTEKMYIGALKKFNRNV